MTSFSIKTRYEPNWTHPRVRESVTRTYLFCINYLYDKNSEIPSSLINKHFGTGTLASHLRKLLLNCTNSSYTVGKKHFKKWKLNTRGLKYIQERLNIKTVVVPTIDNIFFGTDPKTNFEVHIREIAAIKYKEELESGNFIYETKKHRLMHGLQNMPSKYRHEFMSDNGYSHSYDIDCAAPTLLYGYAKTIDPTLFLNSIDTYITKKNETRKAISQECNISVPCAKLLVNAIMCGMRFVRYNGEVNRNLIKILMETDDLTEDKAFDTVEDIINSSILKQLRIDVKQLWTTLKPYLRTRYHEILINKDGTQRKLPSNCTTKWELYFKLEARILKLVSHYADKNNIKMFKEHDGWSMDKPLDQEEVNKYLKLKTGIAVGLTYDNYTGTGAALRGCTTTSLKRTFQIKQQYKPTPTPPHCLYENLIGFDGFDSYPATILSMTHYMSRDGPVYI